MFILTQSVKIPIHVHVSDYDDYIMLRKTKSALKKVLLHLVNGLHSYLMYNAFFISVDLEPGGCTIKNCEILPQNISVTTSLRCL